MFLRSAFSLILLLVLGACSGGQTSGSQRAATTDAGTSNRPTKAEPAQGGVVADVEDEDADLADQPTQISGSFLVDCEPLEEDVPFLEPGEGKVVGGCTIVDVETSARPAFVKITLKSEDGTVVESESLRPTSGSVYDLYIEATPKQLEGKFSVILVVSISALANGYSSTSEAQLLYDTDNVGERFLWDAYGTYINEQLVLPTSELPPAPSDARHLIFVTHKQYPANFGGLAGADAICQELGKSKVDAQREWIALLSTEAEPANKRFVPEGRVYNLMGEAIAEDKEVFWGNDRFFAVKWTEQGFNTENKIDLQLFESVDVKLRRDHVWTGSTADGGFDKTVGNCKDWTSIEFEDRAICGISRVANTNWFAEQIKQTCARGARLYCVSK